MRRTPTPAQVAAENFSVAMVRDGRGFLSLPEACLMELLSSEGLSMSSEVVAFKAIAAWVSHDRHRRMQHLPKLIGAQTDRSVRRPPVGCSDRKITAATCARTPWLHSNCKDANLTSDRWSDGPWPVSVHAPPPTSIQRLNFLLCEMFGLLRI
jgi:BTB And C-terminal Kelch